VTSPFVRRRRLATELRTLREQHGMTAEELSRRLFQSRTKVSRMENAHTRPNLADIMKILDIFNVTGEKWQEIITIARDAAERGWWDTYGDAMGARQRMYADIESGAATIRGYNQMSIPGLLQAPEFFWAIIELDKVEGSELSYEPVRSAEARRRRQQVAFRSEGPTIEVVLDEFVLKRMAVPAHVMADQLRHMVDVLTRHARFTLRVLPLDARLSPGRLPPSTYMTYTFPDPADPTMVVTENANSSIVHVMPDEVAKYERLHDRLRQASLPALETLSLLADMADRLSDQIGPDR
jgi:transcriptional regulator with XRE-family HTH domain